MEGDIVLNASNWPALLGVGATVIASVFGLLKWFASRIIADIDQRLARIDEVERKVEKLMAELPIYYQRREDAVREYTSINAKLDRLYELIVRQQHIKP